MQLKKHVKTSRIVFILLFLVGILLIIFSMIFNSTILAILGITTILWSGIIYYIAPSKSVPLSLFNASVNNNYNLDNLLNALNMTEKGIYLPPSNLKNFESSLIYIPRKFDTNLTLPKEPEHIRFEKNQDLFLIPPGFELSIFFEKKIGVKFTKIKVENLHKIFQHLFVDDLGIAQNVMVHILENKVIIEIMDNVFRDVCESTNNFSRVHSQIGCLFTSALACILAKTTGEAIIIQDERYSSQTNICTLHFNLGKN